MNEWNNEWMNEWMNLDYTELCTFKTLYPWP